LSIELFIGINNFFIEVLYISSRIVFVYYGKNEYDINEIAFYIKIGFSSVIYTPHNCSSYKKLDLLSKKTFLANFLSLSSSILNFS